MAGYRDIAILRRRQKEVDLAERTLFGQVFRPSLACRLHHRNHPRASYDMRPTR